MTLATRERLKVTPDYPLGIVHGVNESGQKMDLPPLTAEERERVAQTAAHLGEYTLDHIPPAVANLGKDAIILTQMQEGASTPVEQH